MRWLRKMSARAERMRRSGFTLVELAAAVMLLCVVMALGVQLVGWVGAERRASARRQWALREADNALERMTALPWDRLTNESVAALGLWRDTRESLPDGRLRVAVDDRADPPTSRRISVEVRWRDRSGGDAPPVRLATWVYRPEEAR